MNNNNKTVLGFAFMAEPKYNASRLALIGTRPGKGYGKQIMNQIYKNAKANGRKKVIVLNAVGSARNFYRGQGYKPRPNTSRNTYGRLFNKSVSVLKRKRSPSPNVTSKRRASPNNRRN
jgi:N-acetylglutamate synthase-like GNAT family acetyltransferase